MKNTIKLYRMQTPFEHLVTSSEERKAGQGQELGRNCLEVKMPKLGFDSTIYTG